MGNLCIIRNIDAVHGYTFKIEIKFVDKLVSNMVGTPIFHEINPKIDSVICKLDKTYIEKCNISYSNYREYGYLYYQ